jgi:beta-mannosidase
VRRVGFDGTVLARAQFDLTCAPFEVAWTRLDAGLCRPVDPSVELLVADVDGQRATWFWNEDVDLRYPPADLHTDVDEVAGGLSVTVTARSLLRELTVFPDRLEQEGVPVGPQVSVDEQLVTLLPGESHTFVVEGAAPQHRAAFAGPPVVRCTNDVATVVGH